MKSFFQFLNEAQSQASMQARKLNLKSDGHGGWLDSRGNFVATTEDGKLKFVDKKQAKQQDEPTAHQKQHRHNLRQNLRNLHLKQHKRKVQKKLKPVQHLERLQKH